MQYRQENNQYVIRITRGEEIMSTIKNFCKEKGIKAAHFTMIGACSDIELAYYHLDTQEYSSKSFPEPRELISLIGNIATKSDEGTNFEEEIAVHAHAVFSDEEMQTIGGHVVKATVHAAAETFMTVFEEPLRKVHDEETGLHLLELDEEG